jgi:hypothetical protein
VVFLGEGEEVVASDEQLYWNLMALLGSKHNGRLLT